MSGACWLGHQLKPRPGFIQKLNVPIDLDRFLHGGIVLVAIGWYFMRRFGQLDEEEITSSLTGIGTIYLFFGGLIYPGFAICFYCALKSRSGLAWFFSVVAGLVPVQAAIFYGRRESTALFVFSLGMCLFFIKGWRPPRLLVLGLIVAAALLIPATGVYRQLAPEDPLEALSQLRPMEEFANYLRRIARPN